MMKKEMEWNWNSWTRTHTSITVYLPYQAKRGFWLLSLSLPLRPSLRGFVALELEGNIGFCFCTMDEFEGEIDSFSGETKNRKMTRNERKQRQQNWKIKLCLIWTILPPTLVQNIVIFIYMVMTSLPSSNQNPTNGTYTYTVICTYAYIHINTCGVTGVRREKE